MSYRIEYRTEGRNRTKGKQRLRLPLMTFFCFLVFLLAVGRMWPEGAAWMQKLMLSSDSIDAVSVLNAFANDLHDGGDLMEACSDFCRDLMA